MEWDCAIGIHSLEKWAKNIGRKIDAILLSINKSNLVQKTQKKKKKWHLASYVIMEYESICKAKTISGCPTSTISFVGRPNLYLF